MIKYNTLHTCFSYFSYSKVHLISSIYYVRTLAAIIFYFCTFKCKNLSLGGYSRAHTHMVVRRRGGCQGPLSVLGGGGGGGPGSGGAWCLYSQGLVKTVLPQPLHTPGVCMCVYLRYIEPVVSPFLYSSHSLVFSSS
jgi:hypothetical protein